MIALVREYIDVFVWNYEDMPGLDLQVAMHRLNIMPDIKLVKQQQRRFHPDIIGAIEAKVHKLIACGFIREVQNYKALYSQMFKTGKVLYCGV